MSFLPLYRVLIPIRIYCTKTSSKYYSPRESQILTPSYPGRNFFTYKKVSFESSFNSDFFIFAQQTLGLPRKPCVLVYWDVCSGPRGVFFLVYLLQTNIILRWTLKKGRIESQFEATNGGKHRECTLVVVYFVTRAPRARGGWRSTQSAPLNAWLPGHIAHARRFETPNPR